MQPSQTAETLRPLLASVRMCMRYLRPFCRPMSIRAPGLSSTICCPRTWTRPWPSVTYRVCPPSWECHALRAPGVKRTAATFSCEGGKPRVMGSTHTSPVKVSAGPFAVAALREISMHASPMSGLRPASLTWVRDRSLGGKFPEEVGSCDATVHEEVTSGDEGSIGAHEQRADGADLVRRPSAPDRR